MGLKEQLEKIKLKTVIVDIPEWGVKVELREPTAAVALLYAKKAKEHDFDIYAMLSMSVYDEDGRVFTTAAQAKKTLSGMGMSGMGKLTTACQKIFGIDVEAAAKNSQETPDGSSSTD